MTKIKYIFPNLFTTLSIILAFFAILYSFEGKIMLSCWLITLAMVCDLLDGKIARLLSAYSLFGAELDSLADFFSFGIAPAIILYNYFFYNLNVFGILLCLMYIIFGAFRLARFNSNLGDLSKKDTFTGMPIPLACGVLISYVIFFEGLKANFGISVKYFSVNITALIILTSILMISNLEFIPLGYQKKHSKIKSSIKKIFVFIILILSLKFSYITFFSVFFTYTIWNLFNNLKLLFNHKPHC